jgi:serine/threonine protein kinase
MMVASQPSPPRRYRLIAEIGRGGMAEVYLAVAQNPGGFNKLVVIKKTREDMLLRPDILSMFMDEARLAARLNHPNVVQTYELGEEDGRQFLAMEFLDGQPYSRVLTRQRSGAGTGAADGMSFIHHLRVLIDTLAGLHHAHELRDFGGRPLHVVHRDVTPHNVFITYDGSIKVLDFGIAKAQDGSSQTATGEIKGKISYMSPEQVRGDPLDRRSDIFAVGVLMWEAVAGRRMWGEMPDVSVLNELMLGHLPSIREAVPDVPDHIARVIERATALDREHRYPTALAMQRELDDLAFLSGLRIDGPEVGRVVSEMFAQERNRVRGVIEAQLGSMRWTGEHPAAPQSLPSIAVGPRPADASGASQLGVPGAVRMSSYTTAPTHSGAALSMRAPEPPPRRWPLFAGLGLAMIGVVAVIAVALVGRARRSEGPIAIGTGAPAPAASGTSSLDESVTLKVRASPPEARILLDGTLLGGGNYEGKVQRGDGERILRVEADGYEPKEEKITLGSDLMMSVSLEKHAGPAGAPEPSTGSPAVAATPYRVPGRLPTAPTTPAAVPEPTGRSRGIDDHNPFK